MAQISPLSNREREVAKLLLEGKSNKLIALALGISDRTVEFHLKNIFSKYQVNTRMELALKLRDAADWPVAKKPGVSTVAGRQKNAENRDNPDALHWVTSLREAVSKIGKEIQMTSSRNSTTRNETGAMTFFESIRTCLVNYAEFNGQASRPEFWWFTLFVVLAASALAYLHETLTTIFLIAFLLPLLAAGARRLRDSGKSPWWELFLLVPVGGIIMLGILWALPPINPLPEGDTPSA